MYHSLEDADQSGRRRVPVIAFNEPDVEDDTKGTTLRDKMAVL
jgi:hypothetical protein